MNDEHVRLETFDTWPPDAPVNPRSLASAGFYYTRSNLEVKCFACDLIICDWNHEDVPHVRHEELRPRCPFIVDAAAASERDSLTNHIPVADVPPDTDVARELYHLEEVRLQSFAAWPVPHIVTPEALARAGFYALGQNDSVQCAYCDGAVGSWERGDCPDREHKRHFPGCPFVVATINPRLSQQIQDGGGNPAVAAVAQSTSNGIQADGNSRMHPTAYSNLNLVMQGNLQELGVQAHTGPKKSMYTTLSARLDTFTTGRWPAGLVQTPELLAQAGFFYEGGGDHVRCFHCDGGLKHWDPHDDPWTEHARWFPNCTYVQLFKGQEFVNACMPDLDSRAHMEISNKRSAPSSTHQPQRRDVTDRELQTHMTAPPALAALNIGLHMERVRQAIKEKLERTGAGFTSSDALIEAALNLQRDEDDSHQALEMPGLSDTFVQMLNDALEQSLPESEQTSSSTPRAPPVPELKATTTTKEMTVLRKKPPSDDSGKVKKPEKEGKLSLEEENRVLKEARLCKICMDSEVGIVFLPCGHLATCVNCAPNLQDCPVCRSSIRATVRTFLS